MEKEKVTVDKENTSPEETLAAFKRAVDDLSKMNMSGVISMSIVVSFLPEHKETTGPLELEKIPDGTTVRTMLFTGGHEPTLYKGAAKLQTDLALRRMKRDGAPQEALDVVAALSEAVIDGKDVTDLAQRLEFITGEEGTSSAPNKRKLN